MRMAIERRGLAMCCPPRVRNAGVGHEFLVHVDVLFVDQLAEGGNLANLLEEVDFILAVAVNGHASRIIATVFETLKAWTDWHVSALAFAEQQRGRGGCVPSRRTLMMSARFFSTR